MCTSIVVNKKKTIVGWNLDLLDMEFRVSPSDMGVFIEVNDATEGWMPLFGANARGDFVGMPTCWPHDPRSNPTCWPHDPRSNPTCWPHDPRSNPTCWPHDPRSNPTCWPHDPRSNPTCWPHDPRSNPTCWPHDPRSNPTCWPHDPRSNPIGEGENVIMLDIDLLLQKKTLQEIKKIADERPVFSIPGVTFMSALSDADGNVLHIIPGQGHEYYEKPDYKILTNFSPYKQASEQHPWMGWDRYHVAEEILKDAPDDFDACDCFGILKAVAQDVCPTVVSMVFDVTDRKVYWCENKDWNNVNEKSFR